MSFVPPVSVKPIVNAASGVVNPLIQNAQKDLETLTSVAKKNGIEMLVVKIVDGAPALTINPELAKYAKMLGLKIV